MRTLENVVYVSWITLCFVYGLFVALLVIPSLGATRDIDAFLRKSPFLLAVAIGCCAFASAATAYCVTHAVRHWPRWVLFLVKLFYFALPSVAAGAILSSVLGWLSLVKPTCPLSVIGVIVVSDLSAGLVGIATMKSIPEFQCRLLTRETQDG